MAKKRTAEGVYNALQAISKEEGVDFGLGRMTPQQFKSKYFTGPGNIGVLHDKLSRISQEAGLDFGQGSKEDWLDSFGYGRDGKNYTVKGGPKQQAPSKQVQVPGASVRTERPATPSPTPQATGLGMLRPEELNPTPELPWQKPKKDKQEVKEDWVKTKSAVHDALFAEQPDFGKTMDAMTAHVEADQERKADRFSYDESHFDDFYQGVVVPIFGKEKDASEKEAESHYTTPHANIFGPSVGVGIAVTNDIAREKYTDPQRVIDKTIKKVQEDDTFTDYVFNRMGIDPSAKADNDSSVPQLSAREKEYIQALIGKESEEVVDKIIGQMQRHYQNSEAPESVMGYLGGRALRENMVASLYQALLRRASGSSGLRTQLRQAAFAEFGKNQHWGIRAIGGAAPFAIDMISGAFAAPAAAGNLVMKGGMKLVAKQVGKGLARRAAQRGISKDVAMRAAEGIGKRYLETQAPILNIALRSLGSATNFATYETQSELIRQLGEGTFSATDLLKEAVHGAALGGALGVAGGSIAHATRKAYGIGRAMADLGGLGAEIGVFATSSAIENAIADGVSIADVDWAEHVGESAGMVLGMKAGSIGVKSLKPKQLAAELLSRYKSSPRYDLQLNEQNLEELKNAGYPIDNLIQGLGKFGEMAPLQETVDVMGTEVKGNRMGRHHAIGSEVRIDTDGYESVMKHPEISSDTKRKVHFILTNEVVPEEPVFGVNFIENEDGSATIETLNAAGRRVKMQNFKKAEEAQNKYSTLKAQATMNTINALEHLSSQMEKEPVKSDGFIMNEKQASISEVAKARTENATGRKIDDAINKTFEERTAEDERVLDEYIKNLQEEFTLRQNERIARLSVDGAYNSGYETTDSEGMNEVQQRERYVDENIKESLKQRLDADPVSTLAEIQNNDEFTEEEKRAAVDYVDAKKSMEGIIQRVRDDIDKAVEENNATIDNITHQDGHIYKLTLTDGREVYMKDSQLVMTDDGTMVNISATKEKNGGDGAIQVVDQNGVASFIDVSHIQNVESPVSADELKQQQTEVIRNKMAEEAAAKIDGTLSFVLGDKYQLTDESGNVYSVTVVQESLDKDHIIVQDENGKVSEVPREIVQQMADRTKQNDFAERMLAEEKARRATPQEAEGTAEEPAEEPAEEQKPAIPQDEKGNLLYHEAPIEATINDLYDGALDDAEVKEFISANIKDAQKKYDKTLANKPKMGTDKQKYIEERNRIRGEQEEAKRVLDYWKDVEQEVKKITHTTDEELAEVQKELSGESARKEYNAINGEDILDNPMSPTVLAGEFIKGAKITPESFKQETGYSSSEQKAFVGMIATEKNGGKTIGRLAEDLVVYDNEEFGGHMFGGDSQEARNAIIEALGGARTQKGLGARSSAKEDAYISEYNRRRDEEYYQAYHLTYEEYLDYREQVLPDMLRKYHNFDEQNFISENINEIEEQLRQRENEIKNEQRIDTTGADAGTERSREVLSGERSNQDRRSTPSTEQTGETGVGLRGDAEETALPEGTSERGEENGEISNSQERNPFEYFKGTIQDLISEARKAGNALIKKIIAPVSSRLHADLLQRGLNVDGYNHVLDNNAIRHAIKQHGGENEINRGQLPITDEDFERLPEIVEDYDNVHLEQGKRNEITNIIYSKSYPDGTTIYVEEKRSGRKELAAVTMWKTKNTTLTDANRNATPISDLSDASVGKGSEQSAAVQGKGEKVAENQSPIQGLDGYTEDEVLSLVRGDIEEKLTDAGIDGVTIKGMALHGSRLRGDASEDSDLDVVVEYEGDMSEDGLFNILNDESMEIEGVRVDVNPITRGKSGTLDQYMERSRQFDALKKAEQETNTEPTEAQKEAGNYKKGHVKIDGYDVTIENPKGSVRRGTDASGKQWEQEMQNTYGYIRGTEGVDGDHIDVFFSEDPSQGDVFVVDQVNKDGSFDEHKVMYGFPDIESARKAYLSNYEDGWQGLGAITPVSKEEFKKWIDSSHRKTKPFAEYSSVKPLGDTQLGGQEKDGKEETTVSPELKSLIDDYNAANEKYTEYINSSGEEYNKTEKEREEAFRASITAKIKLREALNSASQEELEYLKTNSSRGVRDMALKEQSKREEKLHASETFDERIKEQGEITGKGSIKPLSKATVDIAEKNEQRPVMGGVYHDPEGYGVVSDGHTLVASKELYDKKNKGKIIAVHELKSSGAKKGEEIKGKYPKWRMVIPKEVGKTAAVNWQHLSNFLAGVTAEMKKRWQEAKEEGGKDSFAKFNDSTRIALRMPDGTIAVFRADGLAKFVNAAQQLDAKEIEYTFEDRAIAARGKKGLVLQMPVSSPYDVIHKGNVFFYDQFKGADLFGNEQGSGKKSSSDSKIDDEQRVQELASQLEEGNTAKNDALIQQIADMGTAASERWLDENVRGHKVGSSPEAGPVNNAERQVVEAFADHLNAIGVGVSTDWETGQRVLDEVNSERVPMSKGKKRAMETASVTQDEEHQHAVISFADGAKVRNNLITLAENLEKVSNQRKNFIQEVAKAIDASHDGSDSEYATFEAKNGQVVTIRLADHNAKVSNFDHRDEFEGISIVVTPKKNQGIINDGDAHIIEYYYDSIKLRKADGKPLADIVRSIEQVMYSGEYKDTTGLAEREEVNVGEIRQHRVFHGSGADFDTFDHSHMGEGEGAQAYGWGTYVTEVEGIGRTYARSASRPKYKGFDREDLDSSSNLSIPKAERIAARILLKCLKGSFPEAKERAKAFFAERVERFGKRADWTAKDFMDYFGCTRSEAKEYRAESERKVKEYSEYADALDHLNEEDFQLGNGVLYTVEIPDDGEYLDWTITVPKEMRRKIADAVRALPDNVLDKARSVHGPNWLPNGLETLAGTIERNAFAAKEIVGKLTDALGSQQAASELLHSTGFTGIKYPAEYRSGGRADGAKNYVIFDENELRITDKVKFFRTANGEAYGFIYKGKIYLDPRIATSETPIHEYAHLWSEVLEKANPEAWAHLKEELLKDTELLDYVRRLYPEIKDENELMHEVFAHFSGRKGKERLDKLRQEELEKATGVFNKARIMDMFRRLGDLLKNYWNEARKLFSGNNGNLKNKTAEDFADMVMSDLMNGFNPKKAERVHRDTSTLAEKVDEETGEGYGNNAHEIAISDRVAQREYLLSDNYVSSLTGDEFTKSDKPLTERVAQFYADNYDGKVERKGLGNVILDKRGVKDSLSHGIGRNKAAAFAAVPDIIRNGVLIDQKENWKNRKYDSYTIAAPIEIAGEGFVGVAIVTRGHGTNTNKFYLHEVVLQKNLLDESIKTDTEADSHRGDVANVLKEIVTAKGNGENFAEDTAKYRIREDEAGDIHGENFKNWFGDWEKNPEQASKIVDEQGHPLIVEHGTNNDFTEFDINRLGETSHDKGIYGTGFYFATEAPAWLNARNKMKVYLDIKKPFEITANMENDIYTSFSEKLDTPAFRALKLHTFNDKEISVGEYIDVIKAVDDFIEHNPDQVNEQIAQDEELQSYHPKDRLQLWREHEISRRSEAAILSHSWNVIISSMIGSEEFTKAAKESGYDGVIVNRDKDYREYVAFEPSQIKSATENVGTYDRDNDDVRYRIREDEPPTKTGITSSDKENQDVFAERQWRRAKKTANDWVEKLGIGEAAQVYDSIDDVPGSKHFSERKRRAKGWFDKSTGKIVIVIGNNESPADVLKTVLHEAVAHYGLRKLFGKNFDNFLDNVYFAGDIHVKEGIMVKMAKLMGRERNSTRTQEEWRRMATEEYLAELAESTDFEAADQRNWASHWFNNIKQLFLGLLKKIGLKNGLADWVEILSDNELRYILWRSYKNMAEPGRYRNVFQEAEDVAMQSKLGVGNYAKHATMTEHPASKASEPSSGDVNLDKLYQDFKEKHPDALLMFNMGGNEGYRVIGDDRKVIGRVFGMHAFGNDSEQHYNVPSDKLDLLLPKLVRGGFRVGIIDVPQGDVARESGTEDNIQFVEEYENNVENVNELFRDDTFGRPTFEESITQALVKLAVQNKDNVSRRLDAMRAIDGDLSKLRSAMSLQREYDKSTANQIARFARMLMDTGFADEYTRGEVKRMLGYMAAATAKEDISKEAEKLVDLMIDHQLKRAENTLHEIEAIRGSKVDARGVEVQGQLDPAGAHTMKVFKKTRGWEKTDIEEAISEAQQRMGSSDTTVVEEAALEYTGLQLALEYAENIKDSKVEEHKLREEIKQAHDDASERERATESYRQYIASLQEAIRQNKIERAQSYFDLVGRLSDSLRESIANAKDFKEAEKQRIREIQHNANSDMEGRPSDEHYKPTFADKFVNNSFVSFLFAPLATFDQMLRMFGGKSANGEGYLYNRFMRGWVDARQKEINGVRDKYAILDAKAAELFGGKVKTWGDLIRRVGKLPKGTVSFWNGGEMQEREMTQGNLMYIYMVNKMLDGRMKLRKMGITEEKVADIEEVLDKRLIELADWLQNEFLVQTRNEYNETHKRMFGASMAAIEHYFPLKILANARADKPEDLDNPDKSDGISTATGSIIKRRRNALALDITGADALSVILDHVAQMEHWNAFAEFNRDINTLRTYKRFRNQVQNMTTIYGSGKELWKKFNDVCQMASGTYRPPRTKLDEAAVNFAKGVTAAKVSFRMFTALKQFLSMPAYIPEARTDYLLRNIANPVGAWKWSMEHLPIFNERWRSRMSGDPRLLKSDMDWKMWRTRLMQLASRAGMSPNAFVDALTVSIGAHSMYQTRKAQYLRDGYTDEQAERKAIQDAEVLYNQTQQSSEGAFTSTMQVDRSWLSVLFTVFRNASMSYQRQLHDALRNFKHNLTPGGRARSIEFMTKQLLRDKGIEPQTDGNWSDADWQREEQVAKRKFRRQLMKDTLRIATFGYIMQFAWNLGAYLPYLLFGDDEDEKQKMWDNVWARTAFGFVEGLTGGDLMSLAGQMMLTGEGNPAYLSKDMPLTSDIMTALQKLGSSRHSEALNDMINLIVQSGLGVNPQSITDVALSILDACGDDPALAHEATICIWRILQVPQSQIDKIYFDEIGLSGEEVSKYTPSQLAERYARYKVKRGHLVSPWMWDDEGLLEKNRQKAISNMKERMGRITDNGLKEMFDEGDSLGRKLAGIEVAKRLGGTDSYGNSQTDYGQVYSQMRDYVDLAEDVMIQAALKKAKERGDTETIREIEKARREMTEVKKELSFTESDYDRRRVMDVIRDQRHEIMKYLGLW